MIKKTVFFAGILFLILGFCACRVIPKEGASTLPSSESAISDSDVGIGNDVLYAIKTGNYEKFASYISGDMSRAITDKEFASSQKNMEEQFGTIVSYRYLASLQTPLVKNLIWLVTFERKTKENEMVTQDLIFRLILGTVDGKTRVISVGFL